MTMKQRFITLVRHGHCVEDQDDPDLTDLGQRQAEKVAHALESNTFGSVYFSPLLRAKHTADIITTKHNDVKMISLSSLKEGVPTIPPQFRGYFEELSRTRSNLSDESVEEHKRQFDKAFEQIFQPSQQENSHDLVVCHGNIIRYLVCRCLAIDPHKWVQLTVDHCSITQVVVAPDSIQSLADSNKVICMLVKFNETAHLFA